MQTIDLSTVTIRKARDRASLTPNERAWVDELLAGGENSGLRAINLDKSPMTFLRSLLQDSKISDRNRMAVTLAVNGMSERPKSVNEIYDRSVGDPIEFGAIFSSVGISGPNAEWHWNERWYPVFATVQYPGNEDKIDGTKFVRLSINLELCDQNFGLQYTVGEDVFVDDINEPHERSVRDVLHAVGLRPVQTTPREFNVRLANATRLNGQTGQQVLVAGRVLTLSSGHWASGFRPVALGTSERPRKAVVDATLEANERGMYGGYANRDVEASPIPVVRVFSLDLKTYVYVDADDVRSYEYDREAIRRLQLPEDMIALLKSVFATPVADLFGDVVDGKHGGVVILASGNPGVGKTLTSEIYSETTERPLYVLELGELGTRASEVEDNLRAIFARVSRWDAVLQFDECEIFLSHRGEDLERSAIVGIFLRLLDYYEGILFLTSNRPDVIDNAILSRVMIRLDYPDLDIDTRTKIWSRMFEAAELNLVAGSFNELAQSELNGRQIRNLIRLVRILHPDGTVSAQQVQSAMRYGYVE